MAMYDERLRQWPVPFETYLVPGRYGKWGRSVLTTPVAAQCYPLEAVTCAFREFRKRPHSEVASPNCCKSPKSRQGNGVGSPKS
jgi:hypothetical protein